MYAAVRGVASALAVRYTFFLPPVFIISFYFQIEGG